MNAISFHNVSKSFAGRKVLDRLSFSVDQAEVYGLLGPNGCGKSTAINILCNLLDADEGTVQINGSPAGEAGRMLGFCPQEIALYRDLTPAENLAFYARIYGLSAADGKRRVGELSSLFGLGSYARTPVGALSGGWQRRVSIAAALVHKPDVVILDEPTAAVDLAARHELWQLLEMLRESGTTILLTTHHLDEAERLCSRIAIMNNGRIAREGTISELLAAVPARMIATIDGGDRQAVVSRATELGWGVRHYAGRIACLLPKEATLQEVVTALAGLDIAGVNLQRVCLEHAFLEVMQQSP